MEINVSERENKLVNYINKCNCKIIYFNPTQNNTKFSSLINEVYSIYI